MKRFTDITNEINQLEAEKKSEEKARNAAQEKVSELHGNADNEMQKWEELYPSLSFHSIKEEKKKVEGQEEQAVILRQRIEKSGPFIERKEEEIAQLENELTQCQLKEASLKRKAIRKNRTYSRNERLYFSPCRYKNHRCATPGSKSRFNRVRRKRREQFECS
ncbi:hypothetical protein [Thalassobacillus sp. C254]|uniref:hypothetical protein n=1 Tax=Thalassobacillus sp. C254 TaxID=1225341 RepID=UPI0006D021A5|nr:hypothetical protein [Thalassobacillus sp. C254]